MYTSIIATVTEERFTPWVAQILTHAKTHTHTPLARAAQTVALGGRVAVWFCSRGASN